MRGRDQIGHAGDAVTPGFLVKTSSAAARSFPDEGPMSRVEVDQGPVSVYEHGPWLDDRHGPIADNAPVSGVSGAWIEMIRLSEHVSRSTSLGSSAAAVSDRGHGPDDLGPEFADRSGQLAGDLRIRRGHLELR